MPALSIAKWLLLAAAGLSNAASSVVTVINPTSTAIITSATTTTTTTTPTTTTAPTAAPTATNPALDVTYHGLVRNNVELFLNIPYGLDTSGEYRFKPARPAVPDYGSTIYATSYGPACPQPLGQNFLPLALQNFTNVSEDCLNLNIARPAGTTAKDKLPVIVWIYGGSLFTGSNAEQTTAPDGLILESVENGTPVIHVAMNYRLGFFGFAKSDALQYEGSENAGLRDQRLAIEWVRDNIDNFGGDGQKITIFGQSSGGLSVAMQIVAYGGTQPVPFQRAICESTAIEPGITANYTTNAMQAVIDAAGCNSTAAGDAATVACLRALDTQTLLQASISTYTSDISHNIGDIWLPSVDGDFLPDAPSVLTKENRFATDVTAMLGWTDDDVTIFTNTSIATPDDTRAFISAYLSSVTPTNIDTLLSLYPVTDFAAQSQGSGGVLSSEFYRAARMLRDVLMVCQPVWFGQHLASANPNKDVYLYDWNQTVLDPALDALTGVKGWGPVHTSEFAYIFGNISVYNDGFPFEPTPADYALQSRGARSWASFAAKGKPGGDKDKDVFQGVEKAFKDGTSGEDTLVFVVGGAGEGLSAFEGSKASQAMAAQKLADRCAFINSHDMVEQLNL